MSVVIGVVVVLLVLLVLVLSSSVKVLREYERGVIFRLGRLTGGAKGPGLFLLIPMIDRIVRIDLRIVTLQVPPQDIISKDNVPVRVTAVVYFRIVDPRAAVVAIENYLVGTSQIAQTTLRSVLGQHSLDELLAERDRINEILQGIIDQQTEPWGVKVTVVEVKDVELPSGMQRAMARQAEAERERRAKIIGAEGEFQASEKLAQAAQVLSRDPRRCSSATCRPCSRSPRARTTPPRRSSRSRSTCCGRSPRPRSATPTAGTAPRRRRHRRPRRLAPAPPATPSSRHGHQARSRIGDAGRRRARTGRTVRARSSTTEPRRGAPDARAVPVLRRATRIGRRRRPSSSRHGRGLGACGSSRTSSRRSQPPDGAQEVVIHAPAHVDRVRRALAAEVERVCAAWASRGRGAHARGRRIVPVLLDQRRSPASGASLDHTHSQLTATASPRRSSRPGSRASAWAAPSAPSSPPAARTADGPRSATASACTRPGRAPLPTSCARRRSPTATMP